MSLRPWLAEHGCSAATSVLEVNGMPVRGLDRSGVIDRIKASPRPVALRLKVPENA